MNEYAEREAFEKWCGRPGVRLRTDCSGPAYYYTQTAWAWEAWKARAAAPPPPAQGEMKVKPLEWEYREDGAYRASSSIGYYHVFPGTGFSYDLCGPVGGRLATYKRLDDAKAAGNADYEQRIRSALVEPASACPSHPVAAHETRDLKHNKACISPMSVNEVTDAQFELFARALVPFSYGAFEQHGTARGAFEPGKPNAHCYKAARALLATLAHLGIPDLSKQGEA